MPIYNDRRETERGRTFFKIQSFLLGLHITEEQHKLRYGFYYLFLQVLTELEL